MSTKSLAEAARSILRGKGVLEEGGEPMQSFPANVADTGPAIVHPLQPAADYTKGMPGIDKSIPGSGIPGEPLNPAAPPPGDASGAVDTKDSSIPGSNNPQEPFGLGKKLNESDDWNENEKNKKNPFAKKDDDSEDEDDDDKDKDDEDEDDDKKDKDDKKKLDESIALHTNAMISGETLSENFKVKAKTIFEAAVNERKSVLTEQLNAKYAKKLTEAVSFVKEELANKLDDYLSYIVQEWVEENKLAVDTGLKSQLAEDFIGGLKTLFSEHYIDVPDEKIDVVSDLTEQVNTLKKSLNEEIDKAAGLNKRLVGFRKAELVSEVVRGLTDVQAEKIKTLAESVAFDGEDDFKQKVKVLKESYSTSRVQTPKQTVLTETVDIEESAMDSKIINRYADAISKSLPRS